MAVVYLVLAVLGFAVPFSQVIPWLSEHGLNIPLAVQDIRASRIAAFGWWDVILSAVAVVVFAGAEGRRGVRLWWVAAMGAVCVGPSFGLPLLLYFRYKHRA